jgi:hypothetical protein
MPGKVNNQLAGGPSSGSKGQDRKSIQSSLTDSLKVSGYPEKDAKKIAERITKDLNGQEVQDVFEKAKEIYDFKDGKNSGILVAIEGLDPNNINIDYKYEAGKGTEAIWREAISQSSNGDSSDIVKRKITEGQLSEYVKTGGGARIPGPLPKSLPIPLNNEGESTPSN